MSSPIHRCVGNPGSGANEVDITLAYDANGLAIGLGTTRVSYATDGSWQLDYLLNQLPFGKYTLEVNATDMVGNLRTVRRTIYLDNAPPVIQAPEQTTDILTGTVQVTGVVSDTFADALSVDGTLLPNAAGLSRLDVAFVPDSRGSTFLNEGVPMGQLLHLPFDHLQPVDGAPFSRPMISAATESTRCSDGRCPVVTSRSFRWQLAFNGVDQSLQVAALTADLSGGYTLGGWFRVDDVTGSNPLPLTLTGADGNSRQALRYQSATGHIDFVDPVAGAIASSATHTTGQWLMAFVTVNALGDGRLWVNGTQQATFTTTPQLTPAADLTIGRSIVNGVPGDHFHGVLDEVQLYDRALTSAEIRARLQGNTPLLQVGFEEAWIADGSPLHEQSGWDHAVTYESNSPNGAANQAVAGKVGNHALTMNAGDRVRINAHPALDLSDGRFTQAFWLYPQATDNDELLVIGSPITTTAAARYPTVAIVEGTKIRYGFGGGTRWQGGESASVLTPDAWNFVVATFDGTTYRIYLDGQLVHEDDALAGAQPIAVDQLQIGAATNGHLGLLDELQIYGRPLGAGEIAALYHAGWQTLTTANGNATMGWTVAPPAALEGFFTIELRATDRFGNASARYIVWQGLIDTLAPRVTESTTAQGVSYTVEDFNLTDERFVSPCGYEVITGRATYQSPWYLALEDTSADAEQPLYALTASCTVPRPDRMINGCDGYGECAVAAIAPRCYATIYGGSSDGGASDGGASDGGTSAGATVYASIGAKALRNAVAAASAGDTVKIAGSCQEAIAENGSAQVFAIDKPLTFAGGYAPENWTISYPLTQPTTLDALGYGRVISASAALTLTDLTIRGGVATTVTLPNELYSYAGGAILAQGDLTVMRSHFENNRATGDGAAVFAARHVTFMESQFVENRSAARGGAAAVAGTLVISNSTFVDNVAQTTGGALWASDQTTITAGTFTGNRATADGGALWSSGTLVVRNSIFADNEALTTGGALAASGPATLTANRFTENRATFGGALVANAPMTLTQNRFLGNRAAQGAGRFTRLPPCRVQRRRAAR
ncbi:MAG: LamG-like jellyroll fold domain-containing protein [Caldilineaceae bacterium]